MKSRTYFEPMRERESLCVMPPREFEVTTPLPGETSKTPGHVASKRKTRGRTNWQLLRFGLVGCLNTTIDLLVLNGLLQLWPTQNIARLLLFNTIAYTFGALNSFVFNRYWTFQRTGRPNAREGARFLLVTLAAIACNDLILWLMRNILLPVHLTPTLWTNVSKVAAIGGTILVSYLGMRLWVFVQSSRQKPRVLRAFFQRGEKSPLPERTQVRTPISSSCCNVPFLALSRARAMCSALFRADSSTRLRSDVRQQTDIKLWCLSKARAQHSASESKELYGNARTDYSHRTPFPLLWHGQSR